MRGPPESPQPRRFVLRGLVSLVGLGAAGCRRGGHPSRPYGDKARR